MSFWIRYGKGHRDFTVSLFRGNDLEDEKLEAMNGLVAVAGNAWR